VTCRPRGGPHRTIPTDCGAFFDLAGVICWSHALSLSRFAHQHVCQSNAIHQRRYGHHLMTCGTVLGLRSFLFCKKLVKFVPNVVRQIGRAKIVDWYCPHGAHMW
jgi:hypothetical protein